MPLYNNYMYNFTFQNTLLLKFENGFIDSIIFKGTSNISWCSLKQEYADVFVRGWKGDVLRHETKRTL